MNNPTELQHHSSIGVACELKSILMELITNHLKAQRYKAVPDNVRYLYFQFKHSQFSSEKNELRPVDILLKRQEGNVWQLAYICEFGYLSHQSLSVCRWLDFDFQSGKCFLEPNGYWQLIEPSHQVISKYQSWERQFLDNAHHQRYDITKVSLF